MNRIQLINKHLTVMNEYVDLNISPPYAVVTMLNHAYGPGVGNALSDLRRAHLYRSLQTIQKYNKENQSGEICSVVIIRSDSSDLFSIGISPDNFLSGITETDKDENLYIPSLATLNAFIEGFNSLVVALVDGVCSSWGVELALACHYMYITETVRFRFPDVLQGVVPCGGGTLRLCRRIGVQAALQVLCTGEKINSAKALEMRLCDVVLPHSDVNELLNAAKAKLKENVGRAFSRGPGDKRRVLGDTSYMANQIALQRSRTTVGSILFNRAVFAWTEHKIRDRVSRDVTAPYLSLEAVRLAVNHQNEKDIYFQKETTLFQKCMEGKEAQRSQHVMRSSSVPLQHYLKSFATKNATLSPHLTFKENAPHIQIIAVIGAGTIGTSLTMSLLYHFPYKKIYLVEMEESKKHLATSGLLHFLDFMIEERRITPAMQKSILERLKVVGSTNEPFPSELAGADLVIECAPEVTELKKNIFTHLDRLCKRSCIFATGMSTRRVEELALATRRPELVVGLHFYPPANEASLVEVSSSTHTDPAVLHTMVELALGMDKHMVLSYDRAGYAGARIFQRGLYQAYAMLEDGCFPYQIDRALKKVFGWKFGIFELEDIIGLDAASLARTSEGIGQGTVLPPAAGAAAVTLNTAYPTRKVNNVADALVVKGFLGRKTGEGWYKYRYNSSVYDASKSGKFSVGTTMVDNRSRHPLLSVREMTPVVSRDVELLVLKVSKAKSIMRRDISNKEITERIVFSMINEAATMLEEGYVKHASDIDCISVFAHGFPAWKGGLLFYADKELGIKEIVNRMNIYNRAVTSVTFPQPCKTLVDMLYSNTTFAQKFPTQL